MTRNEPAGDQTFTVSHVDESSFEPGLRAYAQYRDLGVTAATKGLARAHVIRFTPPCTDEARQLHAHAVHFQMVYVLKGWFKADFDGAGPQLFKAGSCWTQPPGIAHRVLDYSDDCELLEVILPADFETTELDRAPLQM